MKVFLIGGTGYIGRAVARELSAAGHTAVVLARSEASKAKLAGVDVEFVDGSVEDLDVVVRHSRDADATVYLVSRFRDTWSTRESCSVPFPRSWPRGLQGGGVLGAWAAS